MGWHIHCKKNTLKIDEQTAIALLAADTENGSQYFEDRLDFVRNKDGMIAFNDDHMEHMDYLWEGYIQKVLLDHKVNGQVIFWSGDGDNAGEEWEYSFKDGVVTT